ncbi:hypothetical protein [Paracoccus sp. Ld10]|uniref:hypothetical protein n=1 Tax=Paracoccus sp. Ld10 TaxID=649158 RepID=UPI0038691C5D
MFDSIAMRANCDASRTWAAGDIIGIIDKVPFGRQQWNLPGNATVRPMAQTLNRDFRTGFPKSERACLARRSCRG